MNCPRCGSAPDTISARAGKYNTVERLRVCANGHSYLTMEVLPSAVSHRELVAAARQAARKTAHWARNAQILGDRRPAEQAARDYGVTPARIRQIRKESSV